MKGIKANYIQFVKFEGEIVTSLKFNILILFPKWFNKFREIFPLSTRLGKDENVDKKVEN